MPDSIDITRHIKGKLLTSHSKEMDNILANRRPSLRHKLSLPLTKIRQLSPLPGVESRLIKPLSIMDHSLGSSCR